VEGTEDFAHVDNAHEGDSLEEKEVAELRETVIRIRAENRVDNALEVVGGCGTGKS
jgi:hypothetical protein